MRACVAKRATRPMTTAPLSPAQAAALRRARELAGELTHLVAEVRAALAESAPAPAQDTLAPGEMRAALAAAASGAGRRPRELFGG